MKKHVLIISHGSRDSAANADFKKLVGLYQRKHKDWKVTHAFLELTEPTIPQGLASLAKHSNEITVLPLFLFAAKHVRQHIPEILAEFRKQNPQVKVKLGKPLGSEPKLLAILDQRFKQAR